MEMEQSQQILRSQVPAWGFRKAAGRACMWPMAFLHQSEGPGMTEERSERPDKGTSCGRSLSARTLWLSLHPSHSRKCPSEEDKSYVHSMSFLSSFQSFPVQYCSHQQNVSSMPLKCGWPELRCALSIKDDSRSQRLMKKYKWSL